MADNNTAPTQASPAHPPLPPQIPQQPAGPAPSAAAQAGAQAPEPPRYIFTQTIDYLAKNQFMADIANFQSCTSLITGYPPLDRIQSFYPGLYCLGAISSLGKTTFALQLADQVAATNRCVIYVSLEQGRFELVSKSLARGFFLKERVTTLRNNKPSQLPTPSSMDIRRGIVSSSHPQELRDQIDHYITKVQQHMCIVHGAFSLTVEDITSITEQVIRQIKLADPTAPSPLVIVDYLQIVAPTPINGRIPDTKSSIDHIVHTLKTMQVAHNLTVLAISSLNRQNYMTPIDFESFKESGGIEYTADVIWGLQLHLMNQKEFYHKYDKGTGKRGRETSLKEKRDMINQAKCQSPRTIDLVCLKNRYGLASYHVQFDYYPAHDYVWGTYNPSDPNSLPRY